MRFIHDVALAVHFLSLLSSILLYGYTTVCLPIHQFQGHLYCFQFGAIINNAAIYRSLWRYMFSLFWGKYLRGELLGYVVSVCYIRKCQTNFQSVCVILHSHKWWMRLFHIYTKSQYFSLFNLFLSNEYVVLSYCF